MKRTYGGRRGGPSTGASALDYRDLFQKLDKTSTVFDALSIKNLKQLKRETNASYATWSSQQKHRSARSSRTKKLVKKVQQEALSSLESSAVELPTSTCLTPDKSLRVNRPLDPFDQLCVQSPQKSLYVRKDDELCDQLLHSVSPGDQRSSQQDNKCSFRKHVKNCPKFNLSADESPVDLDSIKENDTNASNTGVNDFINETQSKSLHTSDMNQYKLKIEQEPTNKEALSNSKTNVIKINASFLKDYIRGMASEKKAMAKFMKSDNTSTPLRNTEPLTSTPYLQKINKKYSMNVSPICSNYRRIPLISVICASSEKSIIEKHKTADSIEENKLIIEDNKDSSNLKYIVEMPKKAGFEISLEKSIQGEIIHRSLKSPIAVIDGDKFLESTNIPEECILRSQKSQEIIIDGEPFLGFTEIIDASLKSPKAVIEGNTFLESINIPEEYVLRSQNSQESIMDGEPLLGFTETIHRSLKSPEAVIDGDKFLKSTNIPEGCVLRSQESIIDSEPFLGFTDIPEDSEISTRTSNDLFSSMEDSDYGESTYSTKSNAPKRNISVGECDIKPNILEKANNTSHRSFDSGSTENAKSYILEKENNTSHSSSDSGSSNKSYETCSSYSTSDEECLKQYKDKDMLICVTRMRDSLFYKYYNNINNCDKSFNTSYLEDDTSEQNEKHSFECFVEEAHKVEINSTNSARNTKSNEFSQNNSSIVSVIYRSTALNANEEDYRESISISSDSNCTSTPKKEIVSNKLDTSTDSGSSAITSSTNSSETDFLSLINNDKDAEIVSFVTTRRRNYCMDKSVMLIPDDSFEDSPTNMNVSNYLGRMNHKDDNMNRSNDTSCGTTRLEPDKTDIIPDIDKGTEKHYLEISPIKTESSIDHKETVSPESASGPPLRPSIALLPGKKWERSLSIYRRHTMLHGSTLENTANESLSNIRHSRESLIYKFNDENTRGSIYPNDSVCDRRGSVVNNSRRSTIRIVKESGTVRASLSVATIVEEEIGFLSESCDDTLCELSNLSLSESRLDVTVLEKRQDSACDVLLRRCGQRDVLPFDECYPESVLKNCRKIGEGVYGEVFLYRGQDGRGRVMKVVPVQGQLKVNGEAQKTFQEVISEVVIAMELSALRAPIAEIEKHCDEERDINQLALSTVQNATDAFNEVLAVRCVRGAYPARLQDLWELYDESTGSENDSPEAFPSHQQYVVLELANAGRDLESYQFNSAEQAHALFYQIAYALAVGEEAFQFEHRDLHWGNVLIQPTDQKFAHFVLRGRPYTVARCGVAATIIDYTLSRISLSLAAGDQATIFNDLGKDEELFHAVGDYQFDVYRHMREKTGNDWKKFEPYTNILWLHYTVDKMILELRYKRTNTKVHKHYIAKLKGIKNRLLDYGSAVQFVLTDNQL